MKMAAVVALSVLLGGSVYLGGAANFSVDARTLADASATRSVDAAACASLTSLKLPHTTVISAQGVAAGQFKAPENVKENVSDLPAFCRVAMNIAPSSDSDIKAEVWLPLSGWNGKFEEVGNGGWNGFIQYAALGARCAKDMRPPPPIPDTRETRPASRPVIREADRLRLSRGARNRRARQGRRCRTL